MQTLQFQAPTYDCYDQFSHIFSRIQ